MHKLEKLKISGNKLATYVVAVITLLVLMTPILSVLSPVQYVDGIPLLDRIIHLKLGSVSFFHYLFEQHGNSMHPLVYGVGLLDSLLFHDIPILQSTLMAVGLFFTAFTVIKTLFDEKRPAICNLLLCIFICILIAGGLTYELYLPFQIVLTVTRLLYILIFLALVNCIQSNQFGVRYALVVFFACICAPLHGMGIMFSAAFVVMHIFYIHNWKRVAVSFLPFLITITIHLSFNSGFGEVSHTKSPFLLTHLYDFIKCLFAYWWSPFGMLGISQKFAVAIGGLVFLFVLVKLLWTFLLAYGLNKKLKFLPKNIRDKVFEYSKPEKFLTALIAVSFFACVSAAMFTAARIEFIPSIAENPARYTSSCTRYSCFSVMPYIYLIWIFTENRYKMFRFTSVKSAVLCLIFIILIPFNGKMTSDMIKLNKKLDYAATGILTGVPATTSVTNIIWPEYQGDWYWKDEVPNLLNYYKANYGYIWYGLPQVGNSVPSGQPTQYLSNVVTAPYENEKYETFTATVPDFTNTRYAAVLDCNSTVVGFVYADSGKGLYYGQGSDKDKSSIYFNNNIAIKGFILTSAKASSSFRIVKG